MIFVLSILFYIIYCNVYILVHIICLVVNHSPPPPYARCSFKHSDVGIPHGFSFLPLPPVFMSLTIVYSINMNACC